MANRYPIQDEVAIVGLGSTAFGRDAGGRSPASLACEAAIAAIRDAGVAKGEIDGVVGALEPGAPRANEMSAMLGLSSVRHHSTPMPVAIFGLVDAMAAIFAGQCETVLLYYAFTRLPWNSRSAAKDPFRRYVMMGGGTAAPPVPEAIDPSAAYTAWASRYIHEYGATREDFGHVALNMRANAARNPKAVMKTPLTMEAYLEARMIRDPLCMLDMDVPVDGADAFVLTTTEKAREMTSNPVVIHAATAGMIGRNDEDQLPDLRRHGQHVVVETLKERSELWLDDVDVFFPYDGFSIITLGWIENFGFCPPGGAGRFMREHWDDEAGCVMIDGRIPMNPHGGSLSEGASRGTGHLREAVTQLRGEAGERQVHDAKTALIGCGGFFFNSQGAILRRL
ncbi:MAG: thiolase family protein [Deltaproteobacteria bacterium]|jgi:acetyl-CoA acetyltransferase|nr:thiolase family protein [Deltaproteobacteria bacterium]MBW2498915.1 thiolase family protein [Deltaproteobacteria bacterium]